MPKRTPFAVNRSATVALVMLAVTACTRSPTTAAKPAAPVKVEKLPGEGDLTTITLTAESEHRLGIATADVALRTVEPERWLGGELLIAPEATVALTAPVAGTVTLAKDTPLAVGAAVAADQTLATLRPLLAPEANANLAVALAATEGDVARAEVQVQNTALTRDRAQQLLADRVGSRRAVDDATAAHSLATAALAAAAKSLDTLRAALGELRQAGPADLAVRAPLAGIVRERAVHDGQEVPAGAPLFAIEDPTRLWLRVVVPPDLATRVDPRRPVRFGPPTAATGDATHTASPVAAPPTGDPATGGTVLWFAVDTPDDPLRPGQRVAVRVAAGQSHEHLFVPWSSIVYDAFGGAWVYERRAEHVFVRRRVDPLLRHGDEVALANGPAPGTAVVTAGAAELFGTEFGVGK